MDAGTLPGTDDDRREGGESDRVILHVDMDCFYASCERRRDDALRGQPVVVGMGYEAGETIGAVATASYEAREFGVDSAMPISEALERLPRRVDADPSDSDAPDPEETARYLPVELDYYKTVAAEVKAVLHDCADTVREVSIDEAYLDVTDLTGWTVAGDPSDPAESAAAGPADARTVAEGYARHVKARIEREAGVPASVGVAPNMSTAKVASDFDKPNGLVVVPPGRVREFLAPLPTSEVHGVGPVTEETLAELGVETAGDLASADPEALSDALGDRGRELYERARGDDDREVTPTGLPKSLSRESSLPATADEPTKRQTVSALAADVARRARERGCLYRTIGIKVVRPPYDVNTRANSLPGPVDDPDLVEEVALDLLEEFEGERARKLGVRVSKLDFGESDQATLGGFEDAETADDSSGNHASRRERDRRSGDGGKLTDWVGREPDAEPAAERAVDSGSDGGESADSTDSADSEAVDAETATRQSDGQASLGDWSSSQRSS